VKLLTTPAWIASLAALLAAAAHPAAGLERWPAARAIVPALALLLVVSLLARALRGTLADRVIAAGALLTLSALGADALGGHSGTLTLATGQGTRSFEEEGPGGQQLGLRPLGFALRLDRVEASGEAVLGAGFDDGMGSSLRVGPRQAAAFASFRFGDPRRIATGRVRAFTLGVSRASGTERIVLGPGMTGRAGDAEIALERYFPDFALDANRKPLSRSAEALNPAVLLSVRRAGRAFRVFAIRALPGIHQQEGLDLSFSLAGVEPDEAVRLRVTQAPSAPLIAAGLVVAALGLALALRGAA
jgi:hypothetical protein